MREIHTLSKTEYTLIFLPGSKKIWKLDVSSGCGQNNSLPRLFDLNSKHCDSVSPLLQNISKEDSKMVKGLPGAVCYLHQILIWESVQVVHDLRLKELCKNCGMTLNLRKCVFSRTSQYLGHLIDKEGVHPDPDKIAAMKNYQSSLSKKELK